MQRGNNPSIHRRDVSDFLFKSQSRGAPIENHFFYSIFPSPYHNISEMSRDDGDRSPLEPAPWNEEFQANLSRAGWPVTTSPSIAPPYTSVSGSTSDLVDRSMAIPIYPSLPTQEYPPMTSHVLPSNDPMTTYPAAGSAIHIPAHDPVSRFQSQIAQVRPWSDAYPDPPLLDQTPMYEYLPTGLTSTTGEIQADTLAMTSLPNTEFSQPMNRTLNFWDMTSSNPTPALASPRPPGPERSRRSISQRVDPLTNRSGARTTRLKRAAACWRCRKYRKPVSP